MNATAVNKIVIVGAGFVGASIAFTLLLKGSCSELVLLDINEEKAEGEVMDLMHGLPFVKPMQLHTGDYSLCKDADMVILTAGANQKVGESRMDLVQKNTHIFKQIIPQILAYNRDCIFLIVTNPVDILTYVTFSISGLPRERIIGSGTVLDTARFRALIAEEVGVDARNIHGYILGEHGDTEVATFSTTHIAGIRLDDYCNSGGGCVNQQQFLPVVEDVKNAAYQIIKKKGATYYAVALAASRIVEAILRNEHSILTVCSCLDGDFGIRDVALSVPTVLGRKGIEKILNIPLDKEEWQALEKSATSLKETLSRLEL